MKKPFVPGKIIGFKVHDHALTDSEILTIALDPGASYNMVFQYDGTKSTIWVDGVEQ